MEDRAQALLSAVLRCLLAHAVLERGAVPCRTKVWVLGTAHHPSPGTVSHSGGADEHKHMETQMVHKGALQRIVSSCVLRLTGVCACWTVQIDYRCCLSILDSVTSTPQWIRRLSRVCTFRNVIKGIK
jgi:hypothetical protein